MKRLSDLQNQSGFILMTLLLSVFFIMAIGVAATQLVLSNLQLASVEKHRLNAQLAADAGIDQAIIQVNQNSSWSGATEQTLFEDDTVRTTYQVDVEEIDTFNKILVVTGRTYAPKASAEPRTERKYEVAVRGVGGGDFSVVTGVGGLELRNNAKILDGRVFVNGTITMTNYSQIGLDLLGIPLIPVSVRAAHHSCPSPADHTYPRLCAPGENGQPINMSGSSRIYGRVSGNNQTDGSRMYAPGLVSEPVSATDLPDYDRDGQKSRVAHTMSGSNAGCTLLGIKTWPANTKINGNVNITGVCVITIEGDVWITGNLTIRNTGILVVKNGLSKAPVIMIDGPNGLDIRNAASLNANLSGVGMRMITYASEASCSPDCTNVTGKDLYDSSRKTTISIQDSASGGQTEFYARWSRIEVANSGNLGALVGQTIQLSNSAAITFGARVSGFTNPSAWVVKSYKRVY